MNSKLKLNKLEGIKKREKLYLGEMAEVVVLLDLALYSMTKASNLPATTKSRIKV